MDKKRKWKLNADKFLAAPEHSSKFVSCPGSPQEGTVVLKSRNQKKLDVVWPDLVAQYIVGFCQSIIPPDKWDTMRSTISSSLVHLDLVSPSDLQQLFNNLYSHVLRHHHPLATYATLKDASPILPMNSRYATDFEELEEIGSGGFGRVYKVKSRVDRCFYAVKQIKLKQNFSTKVLNEVKVFAGLHHKNIVRYHNGWMELDSTQSLTSSATTLIADNVKITEITDEDNYSSPEEVEEESSENEEKPSDSNGLDVSEAGDCVKSVSTSCGSFASDYSQDNQIAKRNGKFWAQASSASGSTMESTDEETFTAPPESSQSSIESVTRATPEPSSKRGNSPKYNDMSLMKLIPRVVVFIQMELCSMTLEDYFVKRVRDANLIGPPHIDGNFNRELTIQLLSAIEYIHQKNIIHRDIKPSNIFLKHEGDKLRVLLGDFGLACADDSIEEFVEATKPKRKRAPSVHSRGVGTTLYAAPEQLQSVDYGPSVDIYSAGIVLFEAYNYFGTRMELSMGIEDLRKKGFISETLRKQWPSVTTNILSMTHSNPEDRPSASQLLQQYKLDESATVKGLQEIIKSQEDEITQLRKEIAKLKLQPQQSV